jgi:hypothetical protein
MFDLEPVPVARRQDALALKISAWTPFPNADYYAGWVGGRAHIWLWDASRVASDGAAMLPETALHPAGDGVRLVRCIDGFEAQYWSAGELQKAHWWKSSPDTVDWVQFLRSAGLVPTEEIPAPARLEFTDRPWAKRTLGSGNQLLQQERRLVVAGAALGAFAITWQLVGLYADSAGQTELREALEQRQRAVEPVLQARERALEDQARIDTLNQLYPRYRQLQVMAQAAATLPKTAHLVEWSLEDDRLRLALQGKAPDAGFYVRRFQEVEMYSAVNAERGRTRDQLVLNMDVSAVAARPEREP